MRARADCRNERSPDLLVFACCPHTRHLNCLACAFVCLSITPGLGRAETEARAAEIYGRATRFCYTIRPHFTSKALFEVAATIRQQVGDVDRLSSSIFSPRKEATSGYGKDSCEDS